MTGRRTDCHNTVRHPRRRELQSDCLWVTVSGWTGEYCICGDCRAYLRRIGRTVTVTDVDFSEEPIAEARP